jgi:uncharacterized integral membrane protein (TIGR00698 family)
MEDIPVLSKIMAWSGAISHTVRALFPGVVLSISVAAIAAALERVEVITLGGRWLEALVLAIIAGTVLRTTWRPAKVWFAGINFSAKVLLEIAVLLLGASISVQTIMAGGADLLGGIAAIVMLAIAASYGLGRLFRLPQRMATLVACGNSICGNSAIAAVAPVIGANGEDVSAAIAYTAVLGVIVVLSLPLLVPVLHLTGLQYGTLAGLTAYAVPQVLAATAPVGAIAMQMGTMVKLVRVLMLGPVVLLLTLLSRRWRDEQDGTRPDGRAVPGKLPLHKLIPWYIAGFLALVALRSAGAVPQAALEPLAAITNMLTVISMAALGLSTDVRTVANAGGRVIAVAALSLVLLGGSSLALIQLLGIA